MQTVRSGFVARCNGARYAQKYTSYDKRYTNVNSTTPYLPSRLPAQIPGFRTLLESYRASGRKLFVATNSLWDYTNVAMNFLLSGKTGSDIDLEWLRYFDVVMTGTGGRGVSQRQG